MHSEIGLVAGGLVGGFAVGLTGMGGGAILTPMLVLFFGVAPSAAVGSDLVVSLFIKPVGGIVHWRAGTVRRDVVKALCIGSVPGALLGSAGLAFVPAAAADRFVGFALGTVLVACAVRDGAVRDVRSRRVESSAVAAGEVDPGLGPALRLLPTILLGFVGGVLVGLTSVGSGSILIVALSMLYPALDRRHLVGTDIVQAVPLVAAAALGHLLFGQVHLDVTLELLVGALPGVYLGARLSAGRNSRLLRGALPMLLAATGLKMLLAF